ncbi:MAG: hypothetical protein AAFR98_09415 [Pseudomonadota bacterium]
MRKFCLYICGLSLLTQAAHADLLLCSGETPFWNLDIDIAEQTALFQRTGEDSQVATIELTALAQGDAGIRAFSLVNRQTAFTGIAVTAPDSCDINGDDSFSHRVEFLTQAGTEAILMTGCCRAAQSK